MQNDIILNMSQEFAEYLRDESRHVGSAGSISFPGSEDEIRKVLALLRESATPVTIQGSRTGITAGAVPHGGHVMNLGRMKKVTGIVYDSAAGSFGVVVQPGVLLSEIQESLNRMDFDTYGWSEESLAVLEDAKKAGTFFFPPDPTESSASIGGMVACNASGARTFLYGPTRGYVRALRVVLADGSVLCLRRGRQTAQGYSFRAAPEQGSAFEGIVPSYKMPQIKNASGYYADRDMDLTDLFIGSEGTLGIVTGIELAILPAPGSICGIMTFFESENDALRFVRGMRGEAVSGVEPRINAKPAAIEYFNSGAIELLRGQKKANPAFAEIPEIPSGFETCIYVEFHGSNDDETGEMVLQAYELLAACGGDEDTSWMAMNTQDLGKMRFFRHAVPEAVNLLIDTRRRNEPNLTKLGTDMAVPDDELENIIDMYNSSLKKSGLDSVMFGHIGNNHIHVNIIPESMKDYEKGKELHMKWAQEVIRAGGTVSAEHGIGKLKVGLLNEMYKDEGIAQMRMLKKTFDPGFMLNRGNLF